MSEYTFFATCPVYLEELLKTELEGLGAVEIKIAHGGAEFSGELETAYKVCLWSRIANRILFPRVSFEAAGHDDIKKAAENFSWEAHFSLKSTISIDATLSKTKICTPDYAALSVKDGLVDRARNLTGGRPSVDTANPDIRLHLHVTLRTGIIYLDLSGPGLHKRGYRIESVRAGLRENTAAAVLMRAGWPFSGYGGTGNSGGSGSPDQATRAPIFFDPMCGSGTLVIEAAMISAGIAPALGRKSFGFEHWKMHKPGLWEGLLADARQTAGSGIAGLIKRAGGETLFFGRDADSKAVTAARANIRSSSAAALFKSGVIDIASADFFKDAAPAACDGGRSCLTAVNPPYGERLNRDDDMLGFYSRMGEVFKTRYGGWNISVLTGHRQLSEALGLRAEKTNTVYNGGIRCTLAHFRIFNDDPEKEAEKAAGEDPGGATSFDDLSPGAEMMYNRLKKNAKRYKKWLKNTGITCYRLYDADMPEYAVAVDIYPPNVIIQEYAPPPTIDAVAASSRLREAVSAVRTFLQLPEKSIHIKKRQKQRGSSQYEKSPGHDRMIIEEHGLKFFVDPSSYLDTGIFLDSRPIRRMIKERAEGRNFLNLFCYTATASVYAASGGAASTVSVDTSGTYLDWGAANMKINGFSGRDHSFVREDCLSWLRGALGQWDLIYLDPPTFSNSKDRDDVFDLQRDHEELIKLTASKLSPGGLLIFCCNFRKFKMNEALEEDLNINEITESTIDPDFERKKSIHRCWEITLRGRI